MGDLKHFTIRVENSEVKFLIPKHFWIKVTRISYLKIDFKFPLNLNL